MIARHYDESKNEGGGSLPGVPLGDITEEQYASYPEWLQRSIDALPCYRKTAVAKAPSKAEPVKGDSQ